MEPGKGKMKVGFCLPGGGAKGVRQAGLIKAIMETGRVKPVMIAGTSVGSLNEVAWLSRGWEFLEKLWLELVEDNYSVYRPHFPLHVLQGFLWMRGLYSAKPLQRLYEREVDIEAAVRSKIIGIVTTLNMTTGLVEYYENKRSEKNLYRTHGLTSALYPVAFPWRKVDVGGEKHYYWDGGGREQVPLWVMRREMMKRDIDLDAIFVLHTSDNTIEKQTRWGITLTKPILRLLDIMANEIKLDDSLLKIEDVIKRDRPWLKMGKTYHIYPNPQEVKSSLDFRTGRIEGFEEGYNTGQAFMKELENLHGRK